jgi:hypothetical protein
LVEISRAGMLASSDGVQVRGPDRDGHPKGPTGRHVAIATTVGACLLAVGLVGSYWSLAGDRPAGVCVGIGFGCRPSTSAVVALAAAVTVPVWAALSVTGAVMIHRVATPTAWWLTGSPALFSAAALLWMLLEVAR